MAETDIKAQGCGSSERAVRALTVEEALRRLHQDTNPINGFEKVALRSALDRTLAEDVYSLIDVPSHTNSAMDGYAFNASDLPASGAATLSVIGTALAGKPFLGSVKRGECIRIMTGAPMPKGTDTVIMQEHVEAEEGVIRIGPGHEAGQNVRLAGEDLAKGDLVLAAGKEIYPADLGLLASIGRAEVLVKRRVRVAFFSTGDELRSVGEPLGDGDVYDSNRYTLYGMLKRLGVELIDMGVIRDEREAVKQALLEAANCADSVVTSGGVSVGTADYVKETLETIGEIRFWQIAMRPGRPLAFGRVGGAIFFGLPGNPVSVMVTFYQFVEPALRHMMGQTDTQPGRATFKVRCTSRLRKRAGRTEFQRAILERDDKGELVVCKTGQQGSGILHSMSAANCFIILPRDAGTIEPGMLVEVQPFHGVV